MRPFQILQTCLQNCQVRHREVEFAEVGKIPLALPIPIFVRQFLGERLYQFLAILGTLLPVLLFFHDAPTDIPIVAIMVVSTATYAAFLPVSMICLMSLTTCEKAVAIVLLYSIFLCFFATVRFSTDFTLFSSHYSLLCIFTSLSRMCKHTLRSLIVKILFSSLLKNA
nr:MAG TPA: hypothetical protein [Caudoviricetes sp.]